MRLHRRHALAGSSALVVFAAAFFCFPAGSDAEYVVFDPVWYARSAEREPLRSFVSHHLLFHGLVAAATPGFRALGVEAPGTLATRLLSGAGAAAIVLLLFGLAGPGREGLALLLTALLVATRGFALEAWTGENVLPAAAAALGALVSAAAAVPRPARTGGLVVLALLFRQDNVFLVPAVFGLQLAAAGRIDFRRALVRTGVAAALAGAVTAILYLIAWALVGRGLEFWEWLTEVAGHGNYAPGIDRLGPEAFGRHFGALGRAVIGRQFPEFDHGPEALVGAAFVSVSAAALVCLRGDGAWRGFALGAAVTVLLRVPFFARFEPDNPEWWLLPLVLLAAAGARAAAGRPAAGRPVRAAGFVLLGLVLAATIRTHWPSTWELRDHRLADAARAAVAAGGPGTRFVGFQNRACLALSAAGRDALPLPADLGEATRWLARMITEDPKPTVLLVDLAVQNGYPADLRELRRRFPPEARPDWPGLRLVHARGGVFVFALGV